MADLLIFELSGEIDRFLYGINKRKFAWNETLRSSFSLGKREHIMDKINKREFIKTTAMIGSAALVPAASLASAEVVDDPAMTAPATDLVDEHFSSTTGRHFGSQLIHHGEQDGYQVTPISQDKAVTGY